MQIFPGLGRSPGEGNGPALFSCLGNPMNRGLVGCSPWGLKELEATEQLSTHKEWELVTWKLNAVIRGLAFSVPPLTPDVWVGRGAGN